MRSGKKADACAACNVTASSVDALTTVPVSSESPAFTLLGEQVLQARLKYSLVQTPLAASVNMTEHSAPPVILLLSDVATRGELAAQLAELGHSSSAIGKLLVCDALDSASERSAIACGVHEILHWDSFSGAEFYVALERAKLA